MALSSRPRAPAQLAKLWSTMAMGEVPDDKEQVLAERRRRAAPPEGRAKSAKARAASQTAERPREVARQAAAKRWASGDGPRAHSYKV